VGGLQVDVRGEAQRQRAAALDRALAERAPELREQRAQRLAGVGRQALRPQQRDQLVAGDRALAVDGQVGEHEPALAAGQLDLAPVQLDREPAAQLDPGAGHPPNLTA
jgi:hypothetical protein